jgi:hypothetical protein
MATQRVEWDSCGIFYPSKAQQKAEEVEIEMQLSGLHFN